MHSIKFGCLFLLTSVFLTAQEPLLQTNSPANLGFDGLLYPNFGTAQQHSYFSITYDLKPGLHTQLRVFYDTYQISNRVRAEFLLKKYVTDKLYIFSGLQIEGETQVLKGQRFLPPRLGAVGGVGYDVKENITLEAMGNFQLNDSPAGVFGERMIRMPQVYTLASKIRF